MDTVPEAANHRQQNVFLILLGGFAVVFGLYLRAPVVLKERFPLNDGGLFFVMTSDLVQNGFALPQYTTYNGAGIPFAYPPGGFYLLGGLNQVFHVPLVDLFRYVPLLFSVLTLLAAFPVARLMLASRRQAVLAGSVFAVLQPAYTSMVMGGGVTRSPGLFFATLAVLATLVYARTGRRAAGLAGSVAAITLSAYFHLEIAWITALVMVLLVAAYRKSWRMVVLFLAANAAGGMVLLAPYWLTIVQQHGTGIFLGVFSAGYQSPLASLGLLVVPLYTGESYLQILAVLSALGVVTCLATRQYTPILWLLLVSLVNPRSVHRSAALPVALLVALSLDVLLIQGLGRIAAERQGRAREVPAGTEGVFPGGSFFPALAVFGILLYAFFFSAVEQTTSPLLRPVSQATLEAFEWAATNVEPGASVLVLPFGEGWEQDEVSEWFPALTGRRSVLTVQGYEWSKEAYPAKIATYTGLAECLNSGQACFQGWRDQYSVEYDYLFISRRDPKQAPIILAGQGLTDGCTPVFENAEVRICRNGPGG
jgi:hypothetical protein